MQLLRNMPVRHKLGFIIVLMLGLTLVLEFINVWDYRFQLQKSREVQSREIVSTARSIVQHYYNLSRQGSYSEKDAKAAAKAALADIRYDNTNYVFISDTRAHLVMHPIKPQLDGKDMSTAADPNGFRLFQAFADIANSQGEGRVNYIWAHPRTGEPEPKISYVQLFKPWDWIIGTGVYVDDIDTLFRNQLMSALIALAVVVPLIAYIAMIVVRGITSPLDEINQLMRKVAKGDLTGQVQTQGKDELGKLAQNVNETIQELRTLIEHVGQSCSRIREASEQAASTTQNTFDGVRRQHEETEALATAMNEMAMTAQEVASTAERTAANSHDADEAAHNGNNIVNRTIDRITDVADEMQRLLATISQLEQDTEEVENILNIISDISDQTNLLALNAAIEAARAGDQGRGFAVVADEVRQLAKRTQESTEQIRCLNERLKGACHNAVAMMKNGHEHTCKSATSAEEAGNYIHTIVNQVNEIMDLNTLVASAVKEQSAVAEDMNRNITTISQIAEETSQDAQSTAQTSSSLADLARQLEKRLSTFQI
ncbi:MAG: methyl-accepting chemotaxis protein [Marinobacterium sp.]|nr:methyl-accepting chemotaxis protein [Marinobacterium sp.]